jgi:hypothetical protein
LWVICDQNFENSHFSEAAQHECNA